MSCDTTYLITGANRGIGLALTSTLLLRPNTTVIATIRSPETPISDLSALPSDPTSKLLILPLSSTSDTSGPSLISSLTARDITQIDVLIANAGSSTSFLSTLSTPLSSLREDFETNTLGPIKLFQACYPLISRSSNPKFILISSTLGSIGSMEGAVPSLSYGVSKAAANYVVRKVHFECKAVVALAVHPGWVKTANGQHFADSVGVAAPPMTAEESVKGVIEQIDSATKSSTSGSFVSYDGTVVPW